MTNKQLNIENLFSEITPVEELGFEHIDTRYRIVQMILTALGYILLAASAILLML